LPVARRLAARRFDPFEPLVLFGLAYAAMFVARPAAMLLNDERRFWGLDVRPTLPLALLLALVGAVAFVCGYEQRLAASLARRGPAPAELDVGRVAALSAALAIVGLGALIVFLPSDPGEAVDLVFGGRSQELNDLLRESSTYLWYGSLLVAPAFLLLAAFAARRRSAWLAAAAAATLGLTLVRTVPLGSRIVLLPILGALLVLFYVRNDRRPGPLVLAGIAAVGLLGSYLAVSTRQADDRVGPRAAVERLADDPDALFSPILRGPDAEMVLALSGALTAIPDRLPYRYGRATVGDLATRPIPRRWWPGKPRPPGDQVVAAVWPTLYPGLNPAFSPLLPLYWDFGVLGVFAGMAAFGLLARTFYEWFLAHRRYVAAQLIFAVGVWFVVIAARNAPVDTIVLGGFLVVPVVAVAALAAARRPAGDAAPAVERGQSERAKRASI
jgi:hypothetical protein